MNGYQIAMALFGLLSSAVCLWAIVAIIRSARLRFKPLWLIGSLFGFAGITVDWTTPDDVFFWLGITIPVVTMFKLAATGHVIVKAGFPVIAAIALAEARDSRDRAAP